MNKFINKVFHADARKLLAALPSASVDAVITDAMYGTAKAYAYEWGCDPANGNPDAHWQYHKPLYEECRRVLKPDGVLAWGQGAKHCQHFHRWFGDHRLWTLTRFRMRGKNATGHTWVVQTKDQRPVDFPPKDSLVVYEDMGKLTKLHPCPKPVEELKFLVDSLTKPGDIVLDCFCGLGSTLVAAELLGRRFIGSDISKTYCQITMKRLDRIRDMKVEAHNDILRIAPFVFWNEAFAS